MFISFNFKKSTKFKTLLHYYNYRCTQGGEGVKGRVNIVLPPPQTNFKTLFYKNAMNPEIGPRGNPRANFLESLDPPRDFGKKHQVPRPLP
jgi:hypothetical protein